jgi:uncharacterized membrane protein YdbT with pleckstrin-like domain
MTNYFNSSFLNLPGENIIFKVNPHWLYVVVPITAMIVISSIYLYLIFLFLPGNIPIFKWLPLLFITASLFLIIVIFLNWFCIRYYLTNIRLIAEKGIIGKRIMSIRLSKVQDVTCEFGVLGRIFGFGDVTIESAGTYGKLTFSFIPAPVKIKQAIEKAVSNTA